MLCRVIDTLSCCLTGPIIVVAAAGQQVTGLPREVAVLRDEHDALGPLAGLSVGLGYLHEKVSVAYATSCDVPLLCPSFVQEMLRQLGEREIAIPEQKGYYHPLAAVYRTHLADRARKLVDKARLRPIFLMEECDTVIVTADRLETVDPGLHSLQNLNTPEDYFAALEVAGLARPVGLFEEG